MPLQHRYKIAYGILNRSLSTELDAVVLLGGMLDLPVLHLHPGAVRVVLGEPVGISEQERYFAFQLTTPHWRRLGVGAESTHMPRVTCCSIGSQ